MITKNPQRILIILIAGIGDLILASKAIRSIFNTGKGCVTISLLTSSEGALIAKAYPYFEKVYAFPIRELRTDKKRFLDIIELVKTLHRKEFDQIVNLYRISTRTGALKMGFLFSLLNAKVKIGHDRYGFGHFLTDVVPASTFEGRHVVDAMQEIALKTGAVLDDRGIEIFWNPDIAAKWECIFAGLPGTILIGINPGGDRANRRWAPERFARVATKLIERFNAQIILLGGPAERNIASAIESGIQSDVLNLSGSIPLDELPYIIGRLDLLLTNDSGPMHIAAATQTPLVALFGPEDPRLFGPYTTQDRYRVIQKEVPCRPCREKNCVRPLCLDRISTDEVLMAAIDLLKHFLPQ